MMRLPQEFWKLERLSPIKILADLRGFVLERSHSRLPKWRFRLAPDLVIRIQPKPGERHDDSCLFDCLALRGDRPRRKASIKSKTISTRYISVFVRPPMGGEFLFFAFAGLVVRD